MYIKGKNKELHVAKMNSKREKALLVTGITMIILAFIVLCIGLAALDDIGYSSDKQTFLIGIVVIFLICVEMGGGSLVNSFVLKAVSLIIYDEGVCGTSAKINPICGMFSKTNVFDIKYSEITTVRLENGILLIKKGDEEHNFQLSMTDSQICYRLMIERCK